MSPTEVRVAMVNAQSGPAGMLGIAVQSGAEAYFNRVNAEGGVHGRKIKLIVKDDGYEPARTAALTQELIEQDQAFVLFGYVGTPTSRAVVPLVMQAQIPYLFPFTGAESLRQPVKPWVFNLRASYIDETEELVERLIQDLQIKKIALLMQDDSFGESVKGGLKGALHKRDMRIHGEARIERNSLDVEGAINALKFDDPEAILFVGTYQQLAASIKQAKASGLNARFVTVSFIGTKPFMALAGADGDGVYITQVVPSPDDSSIPLVKQYLADIKPGGDGHNSLEGYLAASVFVRALQQAGPQPTRAKLIAALNATHADFGGMNIELNAKNHQGSKKVFLTRVENGRAVSVERME